MNKVIPLALITALIFTGDVLAEEYKKVIWSCKKPYGKENILWLVEWKDKSYIKVFDDRIQATYQMDGLEKRWNWGLDDKFTYNYTITLSPDRYASYYDFSTSKDGTAKAREKYQCSKN